MLEWAQAFAGRVLNDSGLTPKAQVDRAIRLAYGRAPTAAEEKLMSDFLEKQMAILKTRFANSPDGKIDVRPLTAENAGMLKRYATKAEMETKADVPLPIGMPKGCGPGARSRSGRSVADAARLQRISVSELIRI